MRKCVKGLIYFSVFIVLAACGTNSDLDDENDVTDNQNGSEVEDDTEKNDAETDVENAEDISNEGNKKNPGTDFISTTGIYNGQADPHTIEIETDEGPLAFQLSVEAREDVETLTVGEKVQYTYIESSDNREIQSIQPTETSSSDDNYQSIVNVTGIYNGQADPHTIEIETDEGPKAFQLSMEAREDVKRLTLYEEVIYTYTIDGDYREIQSIKSTETSSNDDLNQSIANATGIYNGQADPHTIEIETNEGPTAFQLSTEAREDVETLTVGEKVQYTYIESSDNREIQSIQPTQ